ncbi:outer membrane protein [hydrocarbon metagenome]|uniref:Outer membrane protein n=1 Tax=hydrocarbon metagenome TaxID=938273 RepID=A0A0W8FKB8_9ZZZZ
MQRRLALCALILMILSVAAIGQVTAQTERPEDKLIRVSGTGKVITTPDRAIISLAVETQHTDVKVAQQENARRMDTVIGAIKAAGIGADDLKTTGYNIYPVYDNSDSPLTRKVNYYRVTNTVMITLRDVDRAGEIIDTGIENGANRVNQVIFTLSDEKEREFRGEALTQAVQYARGDADAVAAALGKTIVDVREATVGGSYVPVVYDSRYLGAAEMAPTPTPIEPGTLEVTASVTISYIIR